MANGHGGKREGADRPPGIANPNAGRPKGAHDVTLSPARIVSPGQKWKFAERAVQYADQMLEVLVDIALHGESEAVLMGVLLSFTIILIKMSDNRTAKTSAPAIVCCYFAWQFSIRKIKMKSR
jgi:hypothetical protein